MTEKEWANASDMAYLYSASEALGHVIGKTPGLKRANQSIWKAIERLHKKIGPLEESEEGDK